MLVVIAALGRITRYQYYVIIQTMLFWRKNQYIHAVKHVNHVNLDYLVIVWEIERIL